MRLESAKELKVISEMQPLRLTRLQLESAKELKAEAGLYGRMVSGMVRSSNPQRN